MAITAAVAIGTIDPKVGLRAATERMTSSDPEVRARGLMALDSLSGQLATAVVARGLNADDPTDVAEAIWSLGYLGSIGGNKAVAALKGAS